MSSLSSSLRSLLLLALLLASSYLVSLNAIPISRLNKLPTKGADIFVSKPMTQSEIRGKDNKIEKSMIEGRMDIELNDYGATSSNPVHTPRPPN
ncbi:hypothetical protein RND81_12G005100 [Saponaria officinalis]|uniref:Uncharacterized protein n=1 Tax=Saponaria officinalis TaxID=3572 RepID=A0AAW1H1L9_SAPOF